MGGAWGLETEIYRSCLPQPSNSLGLGSVDPLTLLTQSPAGLQCSSKALLYI